MRRIHVFILLMMAALTTAVWLAVFVLRQSQDENVVALPTVFVLPSLMPSHTPTDTLTSTHTPTTTSTPTITPSPTATTTALPTLTPTLSTRVLEISAVMPGVYIPPTATDFPFGTILLPAPPHPIEPLPDATHEPPPYTGWYSFESDHPLVQYSTPWQARQVVEASRRQYRELEPVQDDIDHNPTSSVGRDREIDL
jgi:hypothetical protein